MEHVKIQYAKLFADSAVININDGWFWLVSGLCHALEQYCFRVYASEPLKILRVDERLGTLCIQYRGGDEGTEKIIRAVQLASTQVCQLCGDTADTGSTYGTEIQTICAKCRMLDEKFHGSHLAPNVFSEAATQSIEAGLVVMPESWFKKQLSVIV